MAVVVVQNAPQPISTAHWSVSGGYDSWNETLLCQALMRASRVVVGQVFTQDTPQMRLIEDQQFIEAFVAHRSHPALGKGVRIRRTHWGVNDVKSLGPEDCVERLGELRVIVADQEVMGRISACEFPDQLTGLVGDPG